MAYLIIEDFKGGLDVRKSVFTAPPGSLRELSNAHLTRGGEIEKRKAMVEYAALPVDETHGLYAINGVLYVFGTNGSVIPPAGVTYQRLLTLTPGLLIERILSVTSFRGKPYVLAEFNNGSRHHFYNGVQVSDFDAQFGALQSDTDVTSALATLINSNTAVTAVAVGTVITVEARVENVAFTYSSQAIDGGVVDDQQWYEALVTPAGPGTKQKVTFTLSCIYEDLDTFIITINGTNYSVTGQDSSPPTCVKTFQEKVYCTTEDGLLASSGYRGDPLLSDPTAWSPSFAGAGFTDLSRFDENAQPLVAVAVYQDTLAVFSRRSIQIWHVDVDRDKNYLVQVLGYAGTRAAGSIVSLGEIDLFFLADTGIRSLRARDITNLAATQDVGTAIDPEVVAWLKSLPDETVEAAVAAVDPVDGRVFMSIGSRVYVFTHFPGSGVSAWSTYDFGFTVSAYAVDGNRLYARAGDKIYIYGGEDGTTYDDAPIVAKLPFHDCGTPATQKDITGVDVGCVGTWAVSLAIDPENPTAEEVIARTVGSTYGAKERYTAAGHSTHFSLIFRHEANGPAVLANAVLHYNAGEAG